MMIIIEMNLHNIKDSYCVIPFGVETDLQEYFCWRMITDEVLMVLSKQFELYLICRYTF